MPDIEKNETQPDETQAVEEDTNAEAGKDDAPADEQPKDNEATEETEAGDESEDEEGGDELPDWARDKLTKANAEAANYRTKLREAETELKGFEGFISPDDHQAGVDTAVRELLLENVALKHKLPENLRKRLVGNTREELEKDAQELASEFAGTKREVVLEGGLTPRDRDEDANSDPRTLASKHGARR